MTAAAQPLPRARFLRDSGLIAGRHLRVLRMSPGRLVFPFVQPVLLLVLFVSVLGNLALGAHGAGGGYREFLIAGILVQNVVLTAPVSGLALLRDAGSGLADRLRSLPMAHSAVLAGRLAADAVIFAAQAVLLLAVAIPLGFRVRAGLPGLAAIVAVAAVFGVAMATASCLLALLIGDAETAERVLFFPSIVIAFISSAFAPVSKLAGWLQPVARANPVTAAADLIRAVASGGPVTAPLLSLACWTAALALVPGLLAVRCWQARD